jgi:hypothetical protein
MNRLRRTSQVNATPLGSRSDGEHVRSVYAPEPPLCTCSQAGRRSVREVSCRRSEEVLWQGREEGLTGVRP